jgi:polyisoprenoid-binding protein YceI
MTGAGAVQQNAGKNNTLQSFCIVMQANSIKSDKGPIFDSKTHKALKVDKYPEITFLLAEPVTGIPAGAGGYELSARGRLTIAGVTRLVTMSIKITLGCDKKITIAGSQQVKMTDYGIEPPAALFGIIKTGNIITISFSATFTPAMITETGIDKPVR